MVSRKIIASVVAGTLVLAAVVASAAIFRPDSAIRVATGLVAHNVCSKSFVSGLDPQSVFAETVDRDGIRLLRSVLRYRLDRGAGTVDASVAGLFDSRAAFHEGFGCVLLHGAGQPYLLKSDVAALKTPKNPPPAGGNCRSGDRRAGGSRAERRARSRLRGAGRAAVPAHQGGGRGA